jgi:hypothetical protein
MKNLKSLLIDEGLTPKAAAFPGDETVVPERELSPTRPRMTPYEAAMAIWAMEFAMPRIAQSPFNRADYAKVLRKLYNVLDEG